jgi:hypothetical protein
MGSLSKMTRVEAGEAGVPTARPKRGPSLEIDLALSSAFDAFDATPAPRKPFVETPTRQSLEAVRLAEEETRLARGGKTSEVSEVTSIATLDSIGRGEAPASGVSVHPGGDGRVAAMRDLYVQGETDAALALASSFNLDGAEPEPFDIDPFGGLIPVVDDEDDHPLQDLDLATFDGHDAEPALPLFTSSSRPKSASRPRSVEPPAGGEEGGLVALSSLVPKMLVDPRAIAQLPVDPRAAFILSHIDGIQSMEEILDICPMPEAEALELMENLRLLGVISLG